MMTTRARKTSGVLGVHTAEIQLVSENLSVFTDAIIPQIGRKKGVSRFLFQRNLIILSKEKMK